MDVYIYICMPCSLSHTFYTIVLYMLMRDESSKEEGIKQGYTNNKAKQHNTPKAVTLTCTCTMYTNLMKSEVEMLASKKSLLLVAMASLYATCPRRLMRTAGLVGTRVTT